MSETVRTFFSIMKTVIAARMSYRADFFISAIMVFVGEMIIPLITILIYQTGASFPGWSMAEVLLIQGVFMLAKGVAFPLFFGIVWNTLDRVREGTFDLLLLKPRSALYMTLVTGFNTDGLGRLVGGAVVFGAAFFYLPPPGIVEWLGFIILFAVSLSVLFSFALWMSGILFVWVGSSRVQEIFDAVTVFGMYPKTIYAKSFQQAITAFIPIAMIAFFPASALLGRSLAGAFISASVCMVFLGISLWFWHMMLSKYSSAGG